MGFTFFRTAYSFLLHNVLYKTLFYRKLVKVKGSKGLFQIICTVPVNYKLVKWRIALLSGLCCVAKSHKIVFSD